jgi:EAL domain-containing protein (putative c-di-GMP-specific phosphodiesterase class I)
MADGVWRPALRGVWGADDDRSFMSAFPSPPADIRLLLVSADPRLIEAGRVAASRLDAPIDVMPTVDAALAWLLHRTPDCTHVLVPANLLPAELDALAGMVAEVTDGAAPLFVLGTMQGDGRSVVGVDPFDAAGIAWAVHDHRTAATPELPPLDAEGLRAALHDGRLRVRFQPVLEARSLRMIGVEALSRLHHPRLGILRPAAFMAQAIMTGQDRTLSAVAAARAMMDLRGRPFMQGRSVAFNMPMPAFLTESAPLRAREMCAIASLPPERAVVELVETADPPDFRALSAAAARWRDAGFNLTIDDAGPRLPHWRTLLDLPFTGVKLDGSLARTAPEAMAMARDIVTEAKRRGMFVVAEGIEDSAALERMRGLGVDALQGFLFCRPVPARAVQIWAEAWQSLIGNGYAA